MHLYFNTQGQLRLDIMACWGMSSAQNIVGRITDVSLSGKNRLVIYNIAEWM